MLAFSELCVGVGEGRRADRDVKGLKVYVLGARESAS